MRPRLMPEGMEWPRYEDGEPVRIGDVAVLADNKPHEVESMEFFADKSCKLKGKGTPWMNTIFKGQVAKRPAPKVLDADGVEVEVGDDLYSVEGMLKFHVSAIDRKSGRIATEAMFSLDKWADPKMYTHRAPVLAADGKPLREGETVYRTDSPTAFVIDDIMTREDGATVVHLEDGAWHLPQDLTHERPDSWERLEEDVEKGYCDYFGRGATTGCNGCPAYDWNIARGGSGCGNAKMRDLVRRCKALAGVE